MEGSVPFAISQAMYGKIELEKGKVLQENFHDYPVMRHDINPEVHVRIINNTYPPAGVGEPAIPIIVPAYINAYAKATSKRVYSLPTEEV